MKKLLYFFLFLVLPLSNIFSQHNNDKVITSEELKAHVSYLASDELAGRLPGTDGCIKAAEYIRKELKREGIASQYEQYFQKLDFVSGIELGKNNRFSFNSEELQIEEDFLPLSFSASQEVSGEVVFLGYGIDASGDSLVWNDYDKIDITGKIALILKGQPDIEKYSSLFDSHSSVRKKALKAYDKGAKGVIFISEKDEKQFPDVNSIKEGELSLPVIQINRKKAANLLKSKFPNLATMEESYLSAEGERSFPIGIDAEITTDIKRVRTTTQNVVGVISANNNSEEFIVIGAHYDHLGMGGEGSGSRTPDSIDVHNGADDNASGVASVIEIAKRISANREKLNRNVLVAFFTAEEKGLIGSKYFVNHPPVELSKIKYMINLDMVGRLDPDTKNVTIGGSGTAIGLEEMIRAKIDTNKLKVALSPEGYGPSDHASFYSRDIPVGFVFTGVHTDYHTPRDDAELLNYDGQKTVSDFVYDIVMEVATNGKDLAFQEAGPKKPEMSRKKFKVTLGIMPDVASTDVKGLRADAVMKGRPAFNAGMKKGDIIIALDGKKIDNIYDYMNRLSDLKVGQRINVDVLRKGKTVVLIVDL